MKSYKARLKEAEKTIIKEIADEIIGMFWVIMDAHGFVNSSYEYDKTWEHVNVSFKDPVRKDEVIISCSTDDHKFSVNYYAPGEDYESESIDWTGLKRFEKLLPAWLDNKIGWECETCEGEGTYWASEEAMENDEEPVLCPHCNRGKTRKAA